MRCFSFVLAAACLVGSQGALLRGNAESFEVSGDWAALSEAESEDRSFLIHQLDQTEAQLLQLQQYALSGEPKTQVLAGLQISATPLDKKVKPVVKAESKKNVAPTKEATKKDVSKLSDSKPEDMDPAKVAASLGLNLGGAAKGLQGQAALAPMLAMLKGLYQESKERITEQNTREEKSKKWFAEKETAHKAKLDSIEGKFKNHTLSEEFRTNETRDENRYFTYWSRCRERQHRQFHTNLKIQHAMMMKVKKMVDVYEKALSSKDSDQKQAKKQIAQMTGMPEIVFLQDAQRTVAKFCQESIAEVRKERAELQDWSRAAINF
jgi:hypothetical protein